MKTNRIVCAAVVAFAAASASAEITPVGPFTGQITEGFEAVLPPGGYPAPITLFEGAGSIDDSLAHFCVIAFFWQGATPEIALEAYNGNLFGGNVVGVTIFQFTEPQTQFGGYMGTIGPNADGTITFRDADGVEIGTVPVSIPIAQWNWQGWHSDVPFTTIEVHGNNVFTTGTQFDDLQLGLAEEPCTGDVDSDGVVGLSDLAILLSNFGGPGDYSQGDVAGGGTIDLADLALLLSVFGSECP